MALNPANRKQSPIPVVPRTMQLVNPDGTPTRSGQLLLQQGLAPSVTYGAPGEMASVTGLPDGAIYVVQAVAAGGGEVLYQLQGGEWHYIAGTMWGTISPDQRPTGLGPNDAGFEFRSIDTDPLLGGHEWIWSGFAWIEVTANRYGSHGNRLLQPVDDTWNGMIWVETDRSGVIYQLQSGVWHFLAGTMWGTISPDQRPTDLGVNDAGFDYRGTDQAREFIWSGTAWVEITPPGQTPWTSNIDGAGHQLGNVGNISIAAGGVLFIAGLQVVGPRLGIVGAPAISTLTMTRTSGVTYTTNEKDMLTDLSNAVNLLNTDVTNLQATVNDLRARLVAHGLTS